MKKVFSIILFSFIAICAKAQITAADSVSPNVRFNNFPDILLGGDSLDVDLDGQYDFKFDAPAWGQAMYDEGRVIIPLKNNIEVAMIPQSGVYLDTMPVGTVINNSKYWLKDSARYFFNIYERDFFPPNSYSYYYYGPYWGNTDHYMGFRITHPQDTIYGWLQMSHNAYYAKSYAIQISQVGIAPNSAPNNVKLYPNPCKGILHISTAVESEELKIINLVGDEMPFFYSGPHTIDLNSLANGIYFIRVNTAQGVLTNKIILQH